MKGDLVEAENKKKKEEENFKQQLLDETGKR
jgi:hypothetical protein